MYFYSFDRDLTQVLLQTFLHMVVLGVNITKVKKFYCFTPELVKSFISQNKSSLQIYSKCTQNTKVNTYTSLFFTWPICQCKMPSQKNKEKQKTKLCSAARRMTGECENWHTRLFKLGPGEPKHKITSISQALLGIEQKCDQQQQNNREAGRGEGRSY